MKKSFLLLSASFLCLTSCSSNTNENLIYKAGKIIVEKQEERENLRIGETNQLSSHAYGNIKDEVKYESLTPDVLAVTQSGLVTALKEGSGRIKVCASEKEDIYTIINYTVYSTLRDNYPIINDLLSKIENCNLENGASFNMSVKLDIGKVKANISSLISGNILDTSYSSSNDKRISVPLFFEMQEKKDEENTDKYYHLSLKIGDMMESLLSNNTLLNLADKAINLKGMIYEQILNSLDSSYQDYLDKEDHASLKSIDLYSFGGIDFYSAGKKDFSDNSSDIKPYCFSSSNLSNLLSPYAEQIYDYIQNDSNQEEAKPGSFNYKEVFTKDGLLVMMSFLKNYIIQQEEDGKTILSLKEEACEFINTIYKEKFPDPIYSIQSDDAYISFKLPEEIENIYLIIDNTVDSASIQIKGKRENQTYTFLEMNLDSFEEENKNSMNQRIKNVKEYIQASEDFDSINSSIFSNKKTNVKELIKEAKEIKRAELTYNAPSNNEKLMKKKNEFFSYYYNKSLCSDKRRDLLSVMMGHLSGLDYSTQDDFFSYASKTSLNDSDKATFTLNHFYKGKDVDDFTVGYESSNENIMALEGDAIIPKASIYNGRVEKNNVKQTDNSAKITLTATSKGMESFNGTKTFEKTFTYIGSKKEFASSNTVFKDLDNFSKETRELNVKANSQIDLDTVLNLESADSVKYSSLDLRLATVKLLKNNILNVYSPYEESDATEKRNLCGIKATIKKGEKTEEVIFYIRISEE